MTITEFLQSHVAFLQGLTQDQAHNLATLAEQRSYQSGQTVLFRGTTVDGLYVVAEGKVSVWAKPPKAKALVEVAQLGPGEVFGETSIIELGTAGATVKAVEGDTLVFVIPHDAFREILSQNPEFQARAQALIDARKKKNRALLEAPRQPQDEAVAVPQPSLDPLPA